MHLICIYFFRHVSKQFVPTNQEASEIIADYTLSRIPAAVRSSLTNEQLDAIRKALVQQSTPDKNKFALRLTFPFFFRKYYFAVFFGRDRRKRTLENEFYRIQNVPKILKSIVVFGGMSLVFIGFGATLLVGLYLLKNALGIDIFPDAHLRDIGADFLRAIDPER